MEQPTPGTDQRAGAPGALLTYLKKMGSGIVSSAFRGAQVAVFAAIALLAGGAVFAVIGKPAWLAACWLWSNLWNF